MEIATYFRMMLKARVGDQKKLFNNKELDNVGLFMLVIIRNHLVDFFLLIFTQAT